MGWVNGEIISSFIDMETGSKWLSELLKGTQMVNSAFLLIVYKYICTKNIKWLFTPPNYGSEVRAENRLSRNVATVMEFYKMSLSNLIASLPPHCPHRMSSFIQCSK